MIQRLEVKGLNDHFNYVLEFKDDLNIFTGQIGTGKTTLLKLIWYLTSGNLHRIIPEISLTSVEIETSQFSLSLRTVNDKVIFEWKFDGEKEKLETVAREQTDRLGPLNEKITKKISGSVFFSSFGSFEGNYTAEPAMKNLQAALRQFADALSVGHHKFIPAVSNYDIIELLKQKHAVISENMNLTADEHGMLGQRWTLLNGIVAELYGKIHITEEIILGDNTAGRSIFPANLSSGQRRLLSFLCYSAFSEARTIFINQPELDMDPDLQRMLLPILTFQGTEKQFFVTTNSLFIYNKYSDKQISLTI